MSRLRRSLAQIVFLVDEPVRKKARLYAIKENIRLYGNKEMSTKVQISLLGLMAESERNLILEHFAFENALQAMRRHGLPPRRRRRNSLAPSAPERAS
ncbi:recombinase family protein [Desulfocurvibacter africanus]|uniref:recombinase family protein n=1 Tax=Desulfocurvibacter africanus TaxID=873 RepID=UPI0009DA530D